MSAPSLTNLLLNLPINQTFTSDSQPLTQPATIPTIASASECFEEYLSSESPSSPSQDVLPDFPSTSSPDNRHLLFIAAVSQTAALAPNPIPTSEQYALCSTNSLTEKIEQISPPVNFSTNPVPNSNPEIQNSQPSQFQNNLAPFSPSISQEAQTVSTNHISNLGTSVRVEMAMEGDSLGVTLKSGDGWQLAPQATLSMGKKLENGGETGNGSSGNSPTVYLVEKVEQSDGGLVLGAHRSSDSRQATQQAIPSSGLNLGSLSQPKNVPSDVTVGTPMASKTNDPASTSQVGTMNGGATRQLVQQVPPSPGAALLADVRMSASSNSQQVGIGGETHVFSPQTLTRTPSEQATTSSQGSNSHSPQGNLSIGHSEISDATLHAEQVGAKRNTSEQFNFFAHSSNHPQVFPFRSPLAPEAIERPDVLRALNRIEDALQTLQSSHRTRLDLDVPLSDNQNLRIRLELKNGEIFTIFRTDSLELRDALERAWPEFIARHQSEKGLRISEATFQAQQNSPSTNSSGDFRHPHYQNPSQAYEETSPSLSHSTTHSLSRSQPSGATNSISPQPNLTPLGPIGTDSTTLWA
ncbi:MAG: hypothetical protein NZL93_01885 [Chthoniobacterales bacterium]|nr:hypothetical protein [Chthoniobacterales bacterium]